MPEDSVAIQRELNRLEKWADQNLTMFNKAKCKVLHLGRNHTHQYRLGTAQLESSSAENDLEVMVEREPACLEEKEANGILGCIRQKHHHEAEGGDPALYSALVKPHLKFCVQFWPPQLKRNMDILETVQQKAKKIGTEASLT